MDPIRRLIFLALFASVLVAEPTQLRAMTAAAMLDAAEARPTLVTGSWVRRLSNLLRKSVRPIAANAWRRKPRLIDVVRSLIAPIPQVAMPHARVNLRSLYLPPPASPAV